MNPRQEFAHNKAQVAQAQTCVTHREATTAARAPAWVRKRGTCLMAANCASSSPNKGETSCK